MNNNDKMAELLLPSINKTPDYYENLYPERELKEGARVTRIAPSPTGYLHLGTLFAALVNRITATSSGGIFYTRIEDTDKKREVAGAIDAILSGLAYFGIVPDEGMSGETTETGEYGPYKQSLRRDIYACFAKSLVEKGLAYPCFCSEEEIAEDGEMDVRTIQRLRNDDNQNPSVETIMQLCLAMRLPPQVSRLS